MTIDKGPVANPLRCELGYYNNFGKVVLDRNDMMGKDGLLNDIDSKRGFNREIISKIVIMPPISSHTEDEVSMYV